ncbi:MAG TPA: FG-GAP-like repeat-containing protein [bacterium]|nr:FG-GAP-like repeat-containing protein [bacterium]
MAPLTSQKFSVRVSGTLDAAVTWSLMNAAGQTLVDPRFGSITADGTYTAPALVPKQSENDFSVVATSTVDHTKAAAALIHIVPAPLSPARGPTAGGTRIAITGAGFSSATQVLFGGNPGTNVTAESASLLRVTTPASTLASLIGVTDVTIDNGDGHPIVYPKAWHYGATQLRLGGGQLVSACDGSFAVATGDFNNDTKLDVASICAYDQKIAVFLNDGHGGLKPAAFVPTTHYEVWDIQVGDVDGNGTPDIVLAFDAGIQALLNDGTGQFTTGPFLAYTGTTSTYDVSLAVADFDGDGKADAAFALPGLNQLFIAKSTGAGTFGTPQVIATNYSPSVVRAAKIRNANTKPDLLVSYMETTAGSNLVGGFQTALNDGTGTFTMGTTFPAKNFVQSLAVGDFNGDGKLDVAVGSQSGDGADIDVRLGDGLGGFGASTFFADNTGNIGINWRGLAAADLDGDGKADLVDLTQQNIDVFYGSATAPVIAAATRYQASDFPSAFTSGDLGDGVQMIVGDYNQLELYLRQGTRTFGAPSFPLGAGGNPQSLGLLWQNQQASVLAALYKGNAAGNGGAVSLIADGGLNDTTLAAAKQRFDLPAATTAVRVISADMDKDAMQDAVVADDGSNAPFVANKALAGAVYVLPGKADGTLGNTAGLGMLTIPFTQSVSDVAVADIDGDGFPDIIVATNNTTFGTSAGTVVAPTTGTLQVLFGSASGFGTPLAVSAGLVPFKITLADLDDDGKPEILTADQAGNRVAVVKFDGTTPRDPFYVDVGTAPSQVIVTDVNGDYIPDLVVMANYLNIVEIDVVPGLGTVDLGGLQTQIVFDVPDRYRFFGYEHQMSMGDIDGDGLDDIAISLSYPPAIAVMRGHDGGKFLDPEFVPVGGDPWGLTIMDFDQSGTLDLVVGDTMSQSLRPLANKSL